MTHAAGLTKILDHARASQGPVAVLTGAGISAESGIPTFRGPEGYWTVGSRNYQPEELATLAAFSHMPLEIWAWYLYRLGTCRAAQPNVAHTALAALERHYGERATLITQNVDGLHLRAGNTPARTFQIHGNIELMRCARECHRDLHPIPAAVATKGRGEILTPAEATLLRCPRCAGLARPHVLWFDETYDEPYFRFQSSLTVAQRCRLLIVVGTQGNTNLPHHVVNLALASGAVVIDINPQRNPFSQLAEIGGGLWLQGTATDHLPGIVEALC